METSSKNANFEIVITNYLLQKKYCDIHYAEKKESVYIGYWCKSTSVIEVISPLRNVIFKQKRSLNSEKKKKNSDFLPAARRSKGVTEIKWKEREVSFHPHFSYDGFTSRQVVPNILLLMIEIT